MNKPAIPLLALIFSLLLTLFSGCSQQCVPEKPNVIIIFTDDHGYADLGILGQVDDVKTPHIDELARGGALMINGYVTAPQCIPSRAGIITARYQQRFGVEENYFGPLPKSEKTVADRMRDAGYTTGMVGKWHLDPNHQQQTWIDAHLENPKRDERNRVLIPESKTLEYAPGERGFDEYFSGHIHNYRANYSRTGEDLAPEGEYVTETGDRLDIQSDAALAFIERNHENPFFLYLAYFAPHVPMASSEKYLNRFPGDMPERRRYALAMISAMDDGVGRMVQLLKDKGIYDNTIIFFISDNGAPLKIDMEDIPISFRGGAWDGSLNNPWVGEKGMLSEGGIRVPYVVHWNGQIPAGTVYEHPVISLDSGATAVALSGQEVPEELDGVNLVPFLKGEKTEAPHAELYWRWSAQAAIRQGNWKYLNYNDEGEFLFDLSTPEHEKANLISAHPAKAKELREKLSAWGNTLKPAGLHRKAPDYEENEWYQHYFKHESN